MSLDLLDSKTMTTPPVQCMNTLSGALFAPDNILERIASWNKNAEEEAKQTGSACEPVTILQLLEVAQKRLGELEPSNPQYPFWQVMHSVFHAASESVNAESAMQKIAAANDFMRQHPGLGGEWKLSPAVQALSGEERQQLIQKVIQFDGFSKENDPFREHDRGVLLHNGETFEFWIDYSPKEPGQEEAEPYLFAENLAEVQRVLTLMRASERQTDFC